MTNALRNGKLGPELEAHSLISKLRCKRANALTKDKRVLPQYHRCFRQLTKSQTDRGKLM